MRTVLYSDIDMEPITVIDVPDWAASRIKAGERIHFPVIAEPECRFIRDDEAPPTLSFMQCAVWGEMFHRNGQQRILLFTRNEEAALAMRAEFLPGQQGEVGRRCREGFVRGFLAALGTD